jgi:hypothetical protein
VTVATVLLRPPPGAALLDGHRGRDAIDCIHIRAQGGLYEPAGIGVEGFQIAALALVEQDIEGHRTLAAAADAGDDRESPPGDANIDILEIVLARVVNAYALALPPRLLPNRESGDRRARHRRGPIGP